MVILHQNLESPEEEMDEAKGEWDHVALLAKSLGRRVPVDWVARDFKAKGKLSNEVEAFSLVEDHPLFRFKIVERDSILCRGPWVIASQLLAIDSWMPDFVPEIDIAKKTMVWMRLPSLPIEFWST